MKCPYCGGEEFDRGFVLGRYALKYKSHSADFLEKATIFGGEKIEALRCCTCGHIALFGADAADRAPSGPLTTGRKG
jgi:hypothetical protein